MPRNASWLLVLCAQAAAVGLVARRAGPSRESLLPVLRAGQEHGRQLERVAAAALPVDADEERRLGEALARALPPANPGGEGLEALGRRLERTGLAPRYAGRYRYVLVASPVANAYALPGGVVLVTSALVERLGGDESRLGFALAHELAHCELGHTADLVRYKGWLEHWGVPGADLAQALRSLPARAYQPGQELEADALALRVLRAADLRAAAGLETLALLEGGGTGEAGHSDPAAVLVEAATDYFTGHPGRVERRDSLRAALAALDARGG